MQASKAKAALKHAETSSLDVAQLEALVGKLEATHFEALQQREEWKQEVQVRGMEPGRGTTARRLVQACWEEVCGGVAVRLCSSTMSRSSRCG